MLCVGLKVGKGKAVWGCRQATINQQQNHKKAGQGGRKGEGKGWGKGVGLGVGGRKGWAWGKGRWGGGRKAKVGVVGHRHKMWGRGRAAAMLLLYKAKRHKGATTTKQEGKARGLWGQGRWGTATRRGRGLGRKGVAREGAGKGKEGGVGAGRQRG